MFNAFQKYFSYEGGRLGWSWSGGQDYISTFLFVDFLFVVRLETMVLYQNEVASLLQPFHYRWWAVSHTIANVLKITVSIATSRQKKRLNLSQILIFILNYWSTGCFSRFIGLSLQYKDYLSTANMWFVGLRENSWFDRNLKSIVILKKIP